VIFFEEMVDEIERIDGSIIQHGPFNDRIYVMHLAPGDPSRLISKLGQMAQRLGYGKIMVKAPADSVQEFLSAGYLKEAEIPKFFYGKTDCFFVSKFFNNRQKTDETFAQLRTITSKDNNQSANCRRKGDTHNIALCTGADAEELSLLYRQVFPSYPFPISDPSYVSRLMNDGVRYYCIRSEDTIMAAAAIEPDHRGKNAEMTDFATLPQWRGRGLAERLLRHMGASLDGSHIETVYTIARASSYGVNSVFWKCGYIFSGLLINNTQISGSIQSMSVWYRHI